MRLRLDLAYDGTAFHGWAKQTALRTVQGDLEKALDTVLRSTGASLTVAGRTDAGVHARGQVAHVDLDEAKLVEAAVRSADPPLDALARRLNGILATDLRISRISAAPVGFDARYSAVWRRYAYRIADNAPAVDPLNRGHVLSWPRALDLDRMNQAASALLGEHDFAAFCRKRAGATTIRTLLDLRWERTPTGVIVGTVRADAFCHNMVRALVGCLVAVGEGRHEPAWAAEVLGARRRNQGVRVMRPHGLTLEEVAYPRDGLLSARALESRAMRTLTLPCE